MTTQKEAKAASAQQAQSKKIHLAKCRELTVCVKGIEDKEQLDTVQKFDIDRIQGYYCSRPLSLTEAKTVFTESIRIKGC